MSYLCLVCGYDKLNEAPWGDDNRTPSFNICPCCGVEFGYEDALPEGRVRYRNKWVNEGCNWFDDSKKPLNWHKESQLKNIPYDSSQ